jgi:hypothetical protein
VEKEKEGIDGSDFLTAATPAVGNVRGFSGRRIRCRRACWDANRILLILEASLNGSVGANFLVAAERSWRIQRPQVANSRHGTVFCGHLEGQKVGALRECSDPIALSFFYPRLSLLAWVTVTKILGNAFPCG